jgi:hypothetical protein
MYRRLVQFIHPEVIPDATSNRRVSAHRCGVLVVLCFSCLLGRAQQKPTLPTANAGSVERYYSELQKHALSHQENVEEQKIVFKDGGSVVIRHYSADHCTEITKVEVGRSQSVWLFDFPKDLASVHPSKLIKGRPSVIPPAVTSIAMPRLPGAQLKLAVLDNSTRSTSLHIVMFQGVCLNPHPGPFAWSASPPDLNGFQVVNRSWPDGCAHWQIHNVLSGGWGPVNWTSCVH